MFTMVNNEEFVFRIKKILSYYTITAAQMADTIGVQRSNISHLLSGRNKPSLDFVIKIIQAYEEVDLYWLLNGKGSFPKSDKSPTPSSTKTAIEVPSSKDKSLQALEIKAASKKIEHIIIFYEDGSFKKYETA